MTLLLRAAACRSTPTSATLVAEAWIPMDADLVVGSAGSATLRIPNWSDADVLLVSKGTHLHLGPGMRINMCGEGGVDHLIADYEQLVAQCVTLPIAIGYRTMNITLRRGLSIFAKFEPQVLHAISPRRG